MVRHGQASFGRDNYDELSEKGIEQSRILARYWLKTGVETDAIYSGEMVRQRNTAKEVMKIWTEAGLALPELQFLKEFNEYDSKALILSHLEDLIREDPSVNDDLKIIYTDKKAFQRIFEKIIAKWSTETLYKPGIQTWDEFKKTIDTGIQKVLVDNGRSKNIVIFTSGGAISASVQFAMGLSDAETVRIAWKIINSSVSKFLYNEERITLTGFNSTAHLDLEKDPGLITYR
ncbi:MAG: histidine phosphatase family protein [Syntrophales bacterium]